MSRFPHHSWVSADARHISSGETSYLYKGFSRSERDPTFSLSSRLKEKEGLYFRAPIGGLKKNPYAAKDSNDKSKKTKGKSDNNNDEEKGEGDKEQENDSDKKKKKKEKKKKPPTTKEIREHIDKMIEMHGRMVQQETPVIYPLLLEAKKRKRKSSTSDDHAEMVNGKRPINMSGLPIVYGSKGNGESTCKYMLAGQTGKTLR